MAATIENPDEQRKIHNRLAELGMEREALHRELEDALVKAKTSSAWLAEAEITISDLHTRLCECKVATLRHIKRALELGLRDDPLVRELCVKHKVKLA